MRNTLVAVAVLAGLIGCSSSTNTSSTAPNVSNAGIPSPGGGGATVTGPGSGPSEAPATGGSSGSTGSTPGTAGGTPSATQPAPGVLTAGMWDDRLNYDFFGKYLTSHPTVTGDPGFVKADYDAAHTEFAVRAPHTVVDAALIIDTTGSMGDEITYLTSEFANISSALRAKFPNADQRWALVVYRDTPDSDPGDDYVVKSFDFTGDAQAFASVIGAQTAGNGGDYPESPELGIAQLKQLTWRSDPSVAKVAFWVADAPHHDMNAAAMKKAIVDTHAAGIHLYPVSASGTDDLLELTMRSAAEITGGRYMFLTDDSGVGDAHKLPEIPCYFVTKLETALVRAISMELSGSYIGPAAADILRTSGSPTTDGKCTTGDGQTVQIF